MSIARPFKGAYYHIRIAKKDKDSFERACAKRNEVPAEVIRRLTREYTQGEKS